MPRLTLPFLSVIAAISLLVPAAAAQDFNARIRALNLARNTAISLNGGLSNYVPERCMFNSEITEGACLILWDQSGFYFRFVGGDPGWEALGHAPEVETQIQIAPDGLSVVSIEYNGPLTNTPPAP
ncbi:MAG: hypothetical protein VKI83_12395 [Synechococcaceae cyanobacterium]|nr:hypothetical protein [Synechococcaceae cyanobacterium]